MLAMPRLFLIAAIFCIAFVSAGATGWAAGKEKAAAQDGLIDSNSDPAFDHYAAYYFDLYYSYPANKGTSPFIKPSDELDSQGRPKWFDGPAGDARLQTLVNALFNEEHFDGLDHLIDDWNHPDARTADGKWKLFAFQTAMENNFGGKYSKTDVYQKIQRWRKKNPTSPGAAIADAKHWVQYAWEARGAGYINTVSPENYQLFQERLHKAEQTLLDCKSFASGNPIWFYVYLDAAKGLEWPQPEIMKLFHEATQREKYYYWDYFTMLETLSLKWGGNWEDISNFINEAVRITREKDGESIYARLYWSADARIQLEPMAAHDLFLDTPVSWPEMKRGFDDLMLRYPHSAWNLNNYARFACAADDEETFLDLRRRIGTHVIASAWELMPSLDFCEKKFSKAPLPHKKP